MTEQAAPSASLWIGHERLSSGTGGVHEHLHPVTGELQARVPLAGAAEVERAAQKAAVAFEGWRRTAPELRREILLRFAQLIREHAEEFARLAALDGYKTVAIA